MVLAAGAGALANSPSAATPRAFSGNPVAGSQGFGIVVETDASLVGTEAEGPAAIGGDLRVGPGYNVSLQSTGTFIAPGDNVPTSLLVNGAIDFAGSAPNGVLSVLGGGYVKVGDLSNANVATTDQNGALVNTQVVPLGTGYNSAPRVEVTVQQRAASVGPAAGLINFPALFAEYRHRADDMAECANTVILLDPNGVPYPDQDDIPAGGIVQIALSTTETNVLHLVGEQLGNIAELRFLNQPTSDGPLLIVVDTTATGGVFNWTTPNMSALEKTSIGSILWDFPDATDITIASGDTLEGTIFAPRAHLLDVDPSNTEGDIIVRSLEEGTMNSEGEVTASSGEVHYFPFTADIDCGDVSTVTPTSTTPSSQPSTSRPPTSKPPTSKPPTSRPPTSASGTP
ncbi:MAG TPA: collagen-binding domain-containing protein, partial [Yinghuangia sp.]|nr:collagen-binding domain-containing protein [Yinghuangia sp.]